MMAMPGAFALLAGRTEGTCREPIGFALARMGGGEAEIITLGVLPLWRVSGIGQQLVAAIAAQASACGVEALLLEVAEDNAAALKLYQSNGFSSVGRRKNYYQTADSGRHDAIVMRRALVAD